MSLKATRLWESSQKEVKYLETQNDLFCASLASLASSKQSQMLALVSKKFIVTDRVEHEVFTQKGNCKSILIRMKSTLGSIEKELTAVRGCTERDGLIREAVDKCVDEILSNCRNHVNSCVEVFEAISSDPLLSETSAKSLISLVIHRPFLFCNHKSPIADIESLLSIKHKFL